MRTIAALFWLMLGLIVASSASALQGDYKNSDLASDALRLAAQVAQDGDDLKDQTPDSLRNAAATALAKGDTKSTLHAIAGLIAIAPDDSAAWLAYSRAEVASGKTDEILQAASTAAYLAYTKAADKTTAAQALAQLGAVFAQRELWRASLNAYRASLALADKRRSSARPIRRSARPTASAFSITRSTRIRPRRARASSSPNRSPAGSVDFASLCQRRRHRPAAISSEDQQICVEGLHHGEHYTITLRAGASVLGRRAVVAHGGL